MGHLVRLSYPEAPSGTFDVRRHGTAAGATIFSDWECQVPDTGRALNSSGRKTFYVSELVDITVTNASGVAVETFTEGARGDLVGVNSLSWTGTLANGSQGAGGHIALNGILDALRASFGANDGYVRETGQTTDRLLKDALRDIRSANFPWFNVKSSPYSATGNGVADDTNAIQAAITAAAAAGGGVVYLPTGTYLVTAGLSITHAAVSLMGDGKGVSILKYSPAAGYAVTVNTSGTTTTGSMSDLAIQLVNAGGLAVQLAAAPEFAIRSCRFVGTNNQPGIISIATGSFSIIDCVFSVPHTTADRGSIEIAPTLGMIGTFAHNRFIASVTGSNASALRFTGGNAGLGVPITIDTNSCSASMANFITLAAWGSYVVTGNIMPTVMIRVVTNGEGAVIYDTGNFGSATLSPAVTLTGPGAGAIGGVTSSSRDYSFAHVSGTSLTPLAYIKDNTIDATGNITINATATGMYDGAELVLRMRNTTGGAITVTWNAAYLGATAAAGGNIAAGQTRVIRFIRRENGASPGWRYAGHWDTT
jgi:hypothetical protein